MNRCRTGTLLFGLAFGLTAAPALATSISVSNPSFEVLPAGGLTQTGCGAGCDYSIGVPIPGWVSAPTNGDWGQFQPGPSPSAYFNYLTDGTTVAYANNGVLSQTVGATAVAGMTYTLLVDAGFRKDSADPGVVELQVGSTIITGIGTPDPNSGNWATYTATYTATVADAGDSITIVLSSLKAQGDWDNVRLAADLAESRCLPRPCLGSRHGGYAVAAPDNERLNQSGVCAKSRSWGTPFSGGQAAPHTSAECPKSPA
jgi:hypothetical protein